MRLIPGRGISDPLAALLTRKGIHHQMCGAHHAGAQRCSGLERQQFVHQGRGEATPKLGEYLGEHEMPLGALDLDLRDPARIPHGQVGAQLATDLLVGTVQLLFE